MSDDLKALDWHKPAHRAVMANVALGAWMSAALDDPAVCDAMKADIREWFSAGEPMEILGQALGHYRAQVTALEAQLAAKDAEIAAWLRGLTASDWNALSGDFAQPAAHIIATAIASGAYRKDEAND